MRHPNRIDRILSRLNNVWKCYPDLRLGQLILNCFPEHDKAYNVEDEKLIKKLEKTYGLKESSPAYTLNCGKCGNELYRISGLCTNQDGCRQDAYCPECHIRYGVRANGLVELFGGDYNPAAIDEINDLKTTIRTMMEIKNENPKLENKSDTEITVKSKMGANLTKLLEALNHYKERNELPNCISPKNLIVYGAPSTSIQGRLVKAHMNTIKQNLDFNIEYRLSDNIQHSYQFFLTNK